MTKSGQLEWRQFHARREASGNRPRWPNEVMLRVIFGGDYLARRIMLNPDARILDIGCGFGQNLLPFMDRGLNCHGVEIDREIVDVARRIAEESQMTASFNVGRNGALPYPDDFFDLVMSIDTLHYESDQAGLSAALREFARVTKPGGAVFVTTIAPLHDMFAGSEKLGNGRFKVQNYDFRDGEIMTSFESEEILNARLSDHFEHVETGRVTQKLMRASLDWLIAVAQVKKN